MYLTDRYTGMGYRYIPLLITSAQFLITSVRSIPVNLTHCVPLCLSETTLYQRVAMSYDPFYVRPRDGYGYPGPGYAGPGHSARCPRLPIRIPESDDDQSCFSKMARATADRKAGIEGHCIRCDHSHCGVGGEQAECQREGYKSKCGATTSNPN